MFFKGKKLASILMFSGYRRALMRGTAAAVEHEKLLRTLACDTVVDVGANRGQFALVAHRCFPLANIFSFEPYEDAARVFHRLFGNNGRVRLERCAIGANTGTCDLHISRRDDSSSVLPIGKLHTRVFPGTEECGRATVKIQALQDALHASQLGPAALLKIDTEGFELEVLKGCGRLLSSFAYIYLEASFMPLNEGQPLVDDVIDFLQERAFKLRGVYNMTEDQFGRCVQADFLFLNTCVDRSAERTDHDGTKPHAVQTVG